MSEMVERVARALCDKFPIPGSTWQDYVPRAVTAITAMREPTKEMDFIGFVRSGWSVDARTGKTSGNTAEVWRAMIDEALK